MVRPTLCDSFGGEESVSDESDAAIADYLETIAILQDEVARLEQELQWHDGRQRETTAIDLPSVRDEDAAARVRENVAGEPEDVERFQAELVSRDETIRLLLDELIRVEAKHDGLYELGVEILHPGRNFWGIQFPGERRPA